MLTLKISEEQLRDMTTPKVYPRGVELYRQNAVRHITLRDNRLTAQVKGTYQPFYTVVVELEDGEVVAAVCDCEYEFEGWCKHIVATLLTCMHKPESVETLESVQSVVGALEREEMEALLSDLARQDPTLAARIEAMTAQREAQQRLTPYNPPPVRVSDFTPNLVSRSVAILGETGELIQQLIEQGQAESAFQLIEKGIRPLAVELSQIPAYEYEMDERDEQFWAYTILLTELILSTPNPPATLRERVIIRAASWRDMVSETGVDYLYLCAIALTRYWNADPELLEQDNDFGWHDDFDFDEDNEPIDSDFLEDDEKPRPIMDGYQRDLADITLHILEYRGQTRQYLKLARENRLYDRYAIMLALQGELERAAKEAYTHFKSHPEWHGIIRAFYHLGAIDTAFEMARHALEIPLLRLPFFGYIGEPPSRLILAEWLLEHAQRHGRNDLAIYAAQAALEEAPTPERYQRLAQLAGADWDAMRPNILKQLEQLQLPPRGVAEILIQEERYPQALDALIRGHQLTPAYAQRLASHLPDKVCKICLQEAEKIIRKNRSDRYLLAAEWLQVVKETYQAQGREAEWQTYIHSLIEENKRKRSLIPLLERLR